MTWQFLKVVFNLTDDSSLLIKIKNYGKKDLLNVLPCDWNFVAIPGVIKEVNTLKDVCSCIIIYYLERFV